MQRRELVKGFASALGLMAAKPLWAALPDGRTDRVPAEPQLDSEMQRRMQEKIINFNEDFADDIYLAPEKSRLMTSVQARLTRAQQVVGYACFNLISFDEVLKIAAHPQVSMFTAEELTFIEEIFFFDARKYGFYGEKVSNRLTARFQANETVKIAGSGHHLFKGRPLTLYQEIVRDVGHDIVLTSGIRSIVKQLHLFLTKAQNCSGNLSRAARSLAPPGHSFHGISDFDVGKTGWGYRNFSDEFAKSDVFKRLNELGYVDIRYTATNNYGVRFEPWHIKVG